jgi:hypothetical protein
MLVAQFENTYRLPRDPELPAELRFIGAPSVGSLHELQLQTHGSLSSQRAPTYTNGAGSSAKPGR